MARIRKNPVVAGLLGLSCLLLGILIPGGPVETRTFPRYSMLVLAGFNIFLTLLGIVSLALAILLLKAEQRRWPLLAASACGMAYLVVYLLDLAGIFPVSPTPPPRLLTAIEAAGSAVAIVLIAFSLPAALAPTAPGRGNHPGGPRPLTRPTLSGLSARRPGCQGRTLNPATSCQPNQSRQTISEARIPAASARRAAGKA